MKINLSMFTDWIMRLSLGGALILIPFAFAEQALAQTCTAPPPNMVGWWPGDGNANDIFGGSNGVLRNGATFAPGMVGQAFALDGVNDYIDVPDSPSLRIAGSLTVDAWIKLDTWGSFPSISTILTKERDDFNSTNYNFHLVDQSFGVPQTLIGVLFFGVTFDAPVASASGSGFCDTGACFVLGVTTVSTGVFHHVAGVYDDSTKTLKVYLDGSLDGSVTFLTDGHPTTNFGPVFIGQRRIPGNTNFPGLIDEVEIFNRALSATEIQAVFNAGRAGKCKAVAIAIDIKPGSFPNSINLSSAGVVPVAILSSPTFDATTVDPATVSLAGAKVKLIGRGDRYACHPEDVNGDGLLDVVCQVGTAQFLIEPGDSIAVLEANTFSGQPIRGEDSIRIVPD